jgi:hypothetical protein
MSYFQPRDAGRPGSRPGLSLEMLEQRRLLTVPGDANFDGVFDRLDIVQVQQSGRYLSGQPAGWAEGDWNGDGLFGPLDLTATR